MQCNICKQDFSELHIVKVSEILNQSDLNVCKRCENAINNALKIKKYFKYIKDEELREQYIELLKYLCRIGFDSVRNNNCVRLLVAPAGRRRHHSYSGGLLSHIVQMIEIAFVIYHQNTYPFKGVLNKGDIVIGCFIHDIHKAINTFIYDTKSNKVVFAYNYKNKYLPDDFQSIKILMDFGIKLSEQHMNAIIMAEGGFSKVMDEDTEMSKLAVLVHMADLYSSQILKK